MLPVWTSGSHGSKLSRNGRRRRWRLQGRVPSPRRIRSSSSTPDQRRWVSGQVLVSALLLSRGMRVGSEDELLTGSSSRCNGENHLARDCLMPRDETAAMANKKCYKCQETGHIARSAHQLRSHMRSNLTLIHTIGTVRPMAQRRSLLVLPPSRLTNRGPCLPSISRSSSIFRHICLVQSADLVPFPVVLVAHAVFL